MQCEQGQHKKKFLVNLETYLEPCKVSIMEFLLTKIVNFWQVTVSVLFYFVNGTNISILAANGTF